MQIKMEQRKVQKKSEGENTFRIRDRTGKEQMKLIEETRTIKRTVLFLRGHMSRLVEWFLWGDKSKMAELLRRGHVNRLAVLLLLVAGGLAAAFSLPGTAVPTQAKAVTTVKKKQNIRMKKLTPALKRKIVATTPAEPADSDLTLRYPAARITTARLPQGYTHDDTYYYYISQLANTGKHKNDLRVTRIKYKGPGKYSVDYMTLKQFGHGTNLDCVTKDGVTWLWTGGDAGSEGSTTTITCFPFQAGAVLRRHGQYTYRIPIAGSRGYATNCYPAISADGTELAVRFTSGDRQQFQIYELTDGTTIHPKKIKKTVRLKTTPGDFQGFDICGTTIYTLEGSRSKSEMRQLGRASDFAPIRIRTWDYGSGTSTVQKIRGAGSISHREPEGIQVAADGTAEIMIASHYKEKYTCVNVYEVRRDLQK